MRWRKDGMPMAWVYPCRGSFWIISAAYFSASCGAPKHGWPAPMRRISAPCFSRSLTCLRMSKARNIGMSDRFEALIDLCMIVLFYRVLILDTRRP